MKNNSLFLVSVASVSSVVITILWLRLCRAVCFVVISIDIHFLMCLRCTQPTLRWLLRRI